MKIPDTHSVEYTAWMAKVWKMNAERNAKLDKVDEQPK